MRLTKNLGMLLLAIWLIAWGLIALIAGFQWPEPDLGDPRHCGGCFDPAGSVGCSARARG